MEARLNASGKSMAARPTGANAAADTIRKAFEESSANCARLADQAELIAGIAEEIVSRLRRSGTVMFCGNGGSAPDAQHVAAELQGRFLKERAPLAALALTANSSALTALGNDYGFEEIFERQIRGLGKPADVLVAISTSGNSRNVIRALEAAKSIGMYAVGFTGRSGGAVSNCCDAVVRVPSERTPRIQEMHIGVGHAICQIVEDAFS
jgi:D-sedoheptulose 7-phosphate isomerase